jgi:hypothetical protein
MNSIRPSSESQRIVVLLREYLIISKSWDSKKELLIQYANHLMNLLNQRERIIPFEAPPDNLKIKYNGDTVYNLLHQQNFQMNEYSDRISSIIGELHLLYQSIDKIKTQLTGIDQYQSNNLDPNFNMVHITSFQAKECLEWVDNLLVQFYYPYLTQVQMTKLEFNHQHDSVKFELLYDQFQYSKGIQIRNSVEAMIQDRLNLSVQMNKFLQDR